MEDEYTSLRGLIEEFGLPIYVEFRYTTCVYKITKVNENAAVVVKGEWDNSRLDFKNFDIFKGDGHISKIPLGEATDTNWRRSKFDFIKDIMEL